MKNINSVVPVSDENGIEKNSVETVQETSAQTQENPVTDTGHNTIGEEITKSRQACEEHYHEIVNGFKELQSAVSQYREETVRMVNGYAFEKMAYLMRDMENDSNKFADRMEQILNELGIKQIKPNAGDAFDYSLHERADMMETGNVIKECISRGWEFNGDKLIAAIVITE